MKEVSLGFETAEAFFVSPARLQAFPGAGSARFVLSLAPAASRGRALAFHRLPPVSCRPWSGAAEGVCAGLLEVVTCGCLRDFCTGGKGQASEGAAGPDPSCQRAALLPGPGVWPGLAEDLFPARKNTHAWEGGWAGQLSPVTLRK